MSIYYVSANGCDTADGFTPETAWKTIAKVNQSLAAGDEVRFRCGDTFYGQIHAVAGISPVQPTVYTSYGEGEKPVISQYKLIKCGAWEKVSDGVYKIDMTDTNRFDGNTTELDSNAGFFKVSGKIYAHKCFALDELKEQWDFFSDDEHKTIYVYSEKCPCELSDDIRIACNIRCINFMDNMCVSGIVFRGTGGHGINGVTHHAHIYDCEFHEIGGSRLPGYPNPTTRYGNGVECWSNSSDVLVEHCKFSGIYDVAITMQGNNVTTGWVNMYFRNNQIWNCTQALEIWSSGDLPGTGFINCHFEDNICIDSGYCWGYEARPNKESSTHLLMYSLQCPVCDVTITRNFFSNARLWTFYKAGGPQMVPEGYKVFGNTILRPAGQSMIFRERSNEEQVRAFEERIVKENTVVDL